MRGQKEGESLQPLGGPGAVIVAAAHELKTPLTLISHISHILADEALDLSAEEQARYVQRLQLVSQRSLRLIQQLTMSYRLQDAAQLAFAFALQPVNMREVCETALHELTPYAREYRQELQCALPMRPHMVVANRDILYDVVINLVDNAIRHNAPGSAVQLMTARRADRVRLHVHDTGEGIAPSDITRLRRTMGRAPQPFSGHGATSGLGLYIAQQLAGAMGGRIGLGRAPQGTTFFVDLLHAKQLSLW